MRDHGKEGGDEPSLNLPEGQVTVVEVPAAADEDVSELLRDRAALCGDGRLTFTLDQARQTRSELGGEAHSSSERCCSKEEGGAVESHDGDK